MEQFHKFHKEEQNIMMQRLSVAAQNNNNLFEGFDGCSTGLFIGTNHQASESTRWQVSSKYVIYWGNFLFRVTRKDHLTKTCGHSKFPSLALGVLY